MEIFLRPPFPGGPGFCLLALSLGDTRSVLSTVSCGDFDFALKKLLEVLRVFLQDMGSNSLPLIFCPKGLHHHFLVFSRTLRGYSFPYSHVSALFLQRDSFSSDPPPPLHTPPYAMP